MSLSFMPNDTQAPFLTKVPLDNLKLYKIKTNRTNKPHACTNRQYCTFAFLKFVKVELSFYTVQDGAQFAHAQLAASQIGAVTLDVY